MKRIIHMSDLHVGHEDLGDRFSNCEWGLNGVKA
jgi:hypothetical protein